MRIRPIAMGIFVVPELSESQNPAIPGKNDPAATPKNMIRKIHSVR
jgi:hypothetical protein